MIRATFDLNRCSGYFLWRVRIRETPKQQWAFAPLQGGRTDSEAEAWGQISRALAGISIEEIRRDPTSWPVVRDHIRRPGERHNQEGTKTWAASSAAMGATGLAALRQDGETFVEAWAAETERREREAWAKEMDGFAWQAFCADTGRATGDNSAETLAEFETWKVEMFAAIKGRNRNQGAGGFRYQAQAFTLANTRTTDLATLGLAPAATNGDIKATWRRLAMRHHPDRGGDHAEFIRLKTAYERLSGEAGL